MTKIAVLIGSLRSASINKILAKNLEMLLPPGVEFVQTDIDLPLYNQELEVNYPDKATTLKNIIRSADGVLIITPEYNRSFSGVIKNAIDWASRPYPDNAFLGKPIGIVGASNGQTATAQAQSHMRNVMLYLDTKIMGQPELYIQASRTFDENGLVAEASKEYLQKYIDALVAHVNANKN